MHQAVRRKLRNPSGSRRHQAEYYAQPVPPRQPRWPNENIQRLQESQIHSEDGRETFQHQRYYEDQNRYAWIRQHIPRCIGRKDGPRTLEEVDYIGGSCLTRPVPHNRQKAAEKVLLLLPDDSFKRSQELEKA